MSIVGDVAELKFMVLMREMGYTVCKPMSHHSRYDFIVDMSGDMKRVQVKSTNYKKNDGSNYGAYVCHSYTQKRKNRYLKSEVDYIAVYITGCDAWYMIPIQEIKGENIRMYPHRTDSRGKFEKYRIQ
jgi:hypothetical protein